MKVADPCGCFPSGRHYPGIAHLIRFRVTGVAAELDANAPWDELPVALVDLETTGRDPAVDRIVEIGVVVALRGEIVLRRSWLVNPGMPIPKESSDVHGITDADVAGAPPFSGVIGELAEVLGGAVPAAYNATFDRSFLLAEMDRAAYRPDALPPGLRREVSWIDPLVWARELYKTAESRALGEMAKLLGIELVNAHRATDDAEAALRVLLAFREQGIPRVYGGLVQEQRRLARLQEEARKQWRAAKPS